MTRGWSSPFDGEGGGAAWGDLTGTLSDQTDLQTELNGKASNASASNAVVTHEAASNPHPTYLTAAEGDAAYDAIGAAGAASAAVQAQLSNHVVAADPHTGYQLETAKGASNGYAGLATNAIVPLAQLGTGTPDSTKFLRGDQTWDAPTAAAAWGSITGTIGDQADLSNSFAAKEGINVASNLLSNHVAAADPHPVYLTGAEGDAAYAALSHTHLLSETPSAGALAALSTVGTSQIDNDAVTYAKIQNVTDARLLGRSAGSAGDAQEITIGAGLSLAAGALAATGGGGGFTSIALQAKTSSSAYTPTAGTKYCVVILTGAGGGGGGGDSSTTTNDIGVGGGGGAGETRMGFGSVGVFSNLIVTIGAAGLAGSATNGTNGGNGGLSSFGTVITANGGTGGTGSGVAADSGDSNPGGAGGTGGTGGTLAIDGGDGDCSLALTNDATVGDGSYAWAGQGGASYWGGGGRGGQIFSTTIGVAATSAGVAGKAYGAGGGGAACSDTTGGAAGGAGKAGVCLIWEFIS